MLAAESSDLQVVRGDRLAFLLQFKTDDRVRVGGVLVDVEYGDGIGKSQDGIHRGQ
jgi:hypothetical protein